MGEDGYGVSIDDLDLHPHLIDRVAAWVNSRSDALAETNGVIAEIGYDAWLEKVLKEEFEKTKDDTAFWADLQMRN